MKKQTNIRVSYSKETKEGKEETEGYETNIINTKIYNPNTPETQRMKFKGDRV